MKMNLKLLGTLSIAICALALTVGVGAQTQQGSNQKHHHYKLIDIGTFGGPQSHVNPGSGQEFGNFASILNSGGIVTGWADTPAPDPFPGFCFSGECFVVHTFEWKNGVKTDLGVLPGGASSESNWVTENGLIVGLSENGEIDPLIPGFPEFRATLWRDGKVIDLGTLPEGGFESIANAANSRGEVVGVATNTVADLNSMLGTGFQSRAFMWQDGRMEDLGTLPGGSDAQAILVNDDGLVVGWSYIGSEAAPACAFPVATGSFIWDKQEKLRDLGSLGGSCTLATDMNSRGQIVGSSNLPGDGSQHAFLWDKDLFQDLGGWLGGDFLGAFAVNEEGKAAGFAYLPGDAVFHATLWRSAGEMIDLGVVGADPSSYAASINSKNQIVGSSGDFVSTARLFLWEEGEIVDLNALVPPDSTFHLEFAQTINDRGEIAGTGEDANGKEHAFLLIPCDENHPDVEGCDYTMVAPATVEIGARSNLIGKATSAPTPGLEASDQTAEPHRQLGLESNPLNQLFRRRPSFARRLSTSQATALTITAPTAELTITSGTPPNGTIGAPYGPTQIAYRCIFSPVLGFHQVCLPCLPGVATCTSLPPCRGLFPSPCTRVLHGFEFTASGGVPSYRWNWAAAAGSSIPPGLTLDGYGIISGTPTLAGTYHVIVTVADSSSPPLHASASYSITIFQ